VSIQRPNKNGREVAKYCKMRRKRISQKIEMKAGNFPNGLVGHNKGQVEYKKRVGTEANIKRSIFLPSRYDRHRMKGS
jgi:hypothetical protein